MDLHIDVVVANHNNTTTLSKIFALILSSCEKLIELEFSLNFSELRWMTPQFQLIGINFRFSTLTKLQLTVTCFADCLILLDGRFESLSTLIVHVGDIFDVAPELGRKASQTTRSFQR